MRSTPVALIRVTGLLLCAVSVLLSLQPPMVAAGQKAKVLLEELIPHLPARATSVLELLTPVIIAGLFWYCTRVRLPEPELRITAPLLGVQTLLALLIAPELQFIVAVEAGLMLPPLTGSAWVFAQAAGVWGSSIAFPGLMDWVIPQSSDPVRRFIGIGVFMLISMLYNFFAFALGWLATAERRQAAALEMTNRSLAQANRELQKAQEGAAHSARLAERLSIARELHDAIGHQLTALSVNLQLASHLSKDAGREPVQQAYAQVGELLREVRQVVSSMRDPSSADLAAALQAFALRTEKPKIHLTLAHPSKPISGSLSHVLFRCVQEIVTNAVRHSGAENLWIETGLETNDLELRARDDGKGTPVLKVGNGLSGLRERIGEMNGSVSFESEAGRGFAVTIRVPMEAGAAR